MPITLHQDEMKQTLAILATIIVLISCNENPVKPQNKSPIIFSVTVNSGISIKC